MDKSFQYDPCVYFTSFTKTIYSPMAAALATTLEQKALKFFFLRFVKTKNYPVDVKQPYTGWIVFLHVQNVRIRY